MHTELWDVETGNMVSSTDTEEEILAQVRAVVQVHGQEETAPWALLIVGDDGQVTRKIEGAALAELALSAPPRRTGNPHG